MPFDPLDPAPRLPEDTTLLAQAGNPGGLFGVVSYRDTGVSQVSLLQTRTPNYYPSAWNRQVYSLEVSQVYLTLQGAQDAATEVLDMFDKDTPRPPQFPGDPVP